MEEEATKHPSYQLGMDVSEMSVDELEATIIQLKEEIMRLKEAASSKSAHLSAAEALFKS